MIKIFQIRHIFYSLLLATLVLVQFQTYGQNESETKNALNFFLDCEDCDFNFVRQELEFVSFVRDPKLADIHIMSTSSHTGSGGTKYFLNFIGLKELLGQDMEYEYFANQSETNDEVRKGLLKLIKTGILQYYSKTPFFERINIDIADKENKNAVELVDDPWDLWVFNIETGSDFEFEERQNEFSFETELRVEKVTELWKTEIEADYETNTENYMDDDEKIVNSQNEIDISANYIRSLNPHWSVGFSGDYSSETYINIKNAYSFNTGVEYNIFPWDESNRRVFTFRYLFGVNQSEYNEISIYDKLQETLFSEAFELNLRLEQPWGDIRIGLEGRHYFHDFSKNRLSLESQFSVRLTKQLSFYCEIESQVIHDQLYLPKGNATLEDVLLRRRKLATTFEFSGQIGIRFTFGSIFNNVVNERF